MKRRRSALLVLATTLALAAQVTVVAPARATQELRALTCCATHCAKKTTAPGRTASCCRVAATDTTAVSAATPDTPAPLTGLIAVLTVAPPVVGPMHALAATPSRGRAGPVFLLTRSLLL